MRVFASKFLVFCLFILAIFPSFAQQPRLSKDVPFEVQQRISNFLTQTYLSGFIAENDLYDVYYAPVLRRYWKQKNVPLRKVIADKKRHFKRWPYTSYRLKRDSLEIFRIIGKRDRYAVRFLYEFDAVRNDRARSGLGSSQLVLRFVNGTPKIYRETGRVLKRY